MPKKRRSSAGKRESEEEVKWEKILYRKQPFPDNYSGGEKQFLSELRKNVSAVHYEYRDAAFGGLVFITQINMVALYFVLFLNTLHEAWSPSVLNAVFLSLAPMYLLFVTTLSTSSYSPRAHLITLVTLFLFGYSITPVMRTLTTTIDTDTIYATSILTAGISCIFQDYGVKAPVVSYPISMSSGLCSAIFLLSRLKSDFPAFLLLVIAFVLHAYGADFRNQMFALFPRISVTISTILSALSSYYITDFSFELSCFWIFCHLFVVFVCPYILIRKQTSKCTIHGPWDEAIPSR